MTSARSSPAVLLVLLATCLPAAGQDASSPPAGAPAAPDTAAAAGGRLVAVIETVRGTIRCELYAAQVPMAVANFVNLAQRGFYNGLSFHRVYPGQFIQGGSPTGRSDGGPGYVFDNEFVRELRHDRAGTLSMTGGPNGNGSQFFITCAPAPYLDRVHTIFGRVIEGQDVVDAITRGDIIKRVSIEGDPTALLGAMREQVAAWNAVLDSLAASAR